MDPRERFDNPTEVFRNGTERALSRVWTAMPVHVLEDSDGFTVELQPTIKGRDEILGKDVEMPTLGKVPVQFAAGGGFTITHPIKKGDEGIAVFSARNIDQWWDKGGVQPQGYLRTHNLSDAMYIPGIRSKPRALGGNPNSQSGNGAAQHIVIDLRNGQQQQTRKVSTDKLEVRTDKGDVCIEVTNDSVNIYCPEKVTVKCKEMDITASQKLHIETPLVEILASNKIHIESPLVETNGRITAEKDIHTDQNVTANGDITANGDVRAGGVSLRHHTHGGVRGGFEHTQPPDGG
jgi:hypothetical protein